MGGVIVSFLSAAAANAVAASSALRELDSGACAASVGGASGGVGVVVGGALVSTLLAVDWA